MALVAQVAGPFRHLRRPSLYELQCVGISERCTIIGGPLLGQPAGDEGGSDGVFGGICVWE